jgi:ATP-dependent DNA ligase
MFIEPMLLLRSETLPEGSEWAYELKLDGYRALVIKANGKVQLRSRNDNDFAGRYTEIAKALEKMPYDTVIDGEVVALDASGRPSFNALQNYGSSKPALLYYTFDILMLNGRDVTREKLSTRRELLDREVLSRLHEPIRLAPRLEARLSDLVNAVRAQGFEALSRNGSTARMSQGNAQAHGAKCGSTSGRNSS